jgi:hypothetical protein
MVTLVPAGPCCGETWLMTGGATEDVVVWVEPEPEPLPVPVLGDVGEPVLPQALKSSDMQRKVNAGFMSITILISVWMMRTKLIGNHPGKYPLKPVNFRLKEWLSLFGQILNQVNALTVAVYFFIDDGWRFDGPAYVGTRKG